MRSSLRPALEMSINEYLHQDLKLEEIAAIAQISPYHFLRLFKQSMGITPHQYILQCRIEKARYLLQHTKLSIAAIAVRVGFCFSKLSESIFQTDRWRYTKTIPARLISL